MADNESDTAATKESQPIPVRAVRTGFIGNIRRRAGEEFTVQSEEELGLWMERLDGGPNKEPPVVTKPGKKK